MSTNHEYEKIQLTKDDIKYLYGQIYSNITSKLDLHLPTSNNDPLKTRVATLLEEFLLDTFEMARSSVIIDGHDSSSMDNLQPISELLSFKPREMIEPFDFELNRSLRSVLQRFEEETVEVSSLRREMPHNAKLLYQNIISNTDKEVSEVLASIDQDVEKLQEELSALDKDVPLQEAMNQLVEDYQTSIIRLSLLKKSIPEQKAELDKLNEALKFLEHAYNRQMEQEKLLL